MTDNGWRSVTIAGLVTEPGNSVDYETGGWRSSRPIIDLEKCTNCLFCWIFCPDGSVIVQDGEVKGIDLSHCKGCGICATECPKELIVMVDERKAKAEESK